VANNVVYVMSDGARPGFHRAAIVVAANGMTVNVQVFTDGNKHEGDCRNNVFWRRNVPYDETGTKHGTWHWAEDVTA
jgi:hypothetical protein